MIARHVFVLSQICPLLVCDCLPLAADVVVFLGSFSRSRTALTAENVLRKQLAFYQVHQVKPRRLTDSAWLALVFWSHFFDWRSALVIIQPATLVGWHRKAFPISEVEVATRKTAVTAEPSPTHRTAWFRRIRLGCDLENCWI